MVKFNAKGITKDITKDSRAMSVLAIGGTILGFLIFNKLRGGPAAQADRPVLPSDDATPPDGPPTLKPGSDTSPEEARAAQTAAALEELRASLTAELASRGFTGVLQGRSVLELQTNYQLEVEAIDQGVAKEELRTPIPPRDTTDLEVQRAYMINDLWLRGWDVNWIPGSTYDEIYAEYERLYWHQVGG